MARNIQREKSRSPSSAPATTRKRPRVAETKNDSPSQKIILRLPVRDHPLGDNKDLQWSNGCHQAALDTKLTLGRSNCPANRSTRSTQAETEPKIEVAKQPTVRGHTATVKATFVLDGKPFIVSSKIDNLDTTKQTHNLEIATLDIFDANKKSIPFTKTLIEADTSSDERCKIRPSPTAPLNLIHNTTATPGRPSDAASAQLLTYLEQSLGNTAVFPPFQGRRVYMHYKDNEVSPEEKMAKMARYAWNPPNGRGEQNVQRETGKAEQFVLKLERKRGIKVEFEDEQGGSLVRRIKRVGVEADE